MTSSSPSIQVQAIAEKIVKKVEQREDIYTDVRDRSCRKASAEVDKQRGDDDFMEWVKNYAWAKESAVKELDKATGYPGILARAEQAACDVYVTEGARPLEYGEDATEKARAEDKRRYGRAYRAARDVYVASCRAALAKYHATQKPSS